MTRPTRGRSLRPAPPFNPFEGEPMVVTCPKCLSEAAVTVDLDDGETLRCPECDETYTVAEVAAVVESWAKLLPWLMSHPARRPECKAVA